MAQRLNVLVVEDDNDNATSLAMLLRANGYAAHVCLDPKDALAHIEQLRPAVVMLDLEMPGMSGLEIAEELQQHADLRPQLLAAVTGYGRESDREKTRALGFDRHFLKPIDWHDVRAALDAVATRSLATS